jgi:predicted peptidase
MKTQIVITGILLSLIFFCFTGKSHAQSKNLQQAHCFKGKTSLNYLLYLPQNYSTETAEAFPLILFLHGSGERGDSINKVKAWGPPKIAEEKGLPFIVVSPQCPLNETWVSMLFPLRQLLDEIIANYNVDTSRVYLTGLSMGGFGTFAMAQAYPEYFAATAPVCGGGTPGLVKYSKNIPTWIFHGDADDVVLPENSVAMYNALKENGADAKLTLFPGVNHGSWIPAYNESGLFEWFLTHKKQ